MALVKFVLYNLFLPFPFWSDKGQPEIKDKLKKDHDHVGRIREGHKIVCYLGSWANYRNGEGKFLIEDIDPYLCTHLIYTFAKLGPDNKIASYDKYLDCKENWGLGAYERFTGLKKKNPQLKTLLAIGGWNEGSTKYSKMARDPSSRKVFVESCVQMLKKYDFDGLDLDWEYPAARGGVPDDKKNFVLLLKELKEAFRPHSLVLTAAVSAGQATIDNAYDIPSLGRYLDLINLMAYDFHGGWDKRTGHNAPLCARPNETSEDKKLNVDFAVQYWLKGGAPANKLILGMPAYGRTFTLKDPSISGLDAPVTGQGIAGAFTRERGYLGYNEICKRLKNEKDWKLTLDKHVQAPYAVKGRQWLGFDDVKSITEKVNYLLKMKLGGAMIWSIETDDFHGKCHGHKFPLLLAMQAALNGSGPHLRSYTLPDQKYDQHNSILPITRQTSRTTTIGTTYTTQKTEENDSAKIPLSCTEAGYFRHPRDCKLFYLCQPRRPGWAAGYHVYLFTCGAGTVFSEVMGNCAHPISVPQCVQMKK